MKLAPPVSHVPAAVPDTGPLEPADAAQLSQAFVLAGLTEFARQRLGTPSPVFEALAGDPDCNGLWLQLGTPPDEWNAACRALARRAPALRGPLGRLLQDLRLQLHEWFALALCGENESSHLLNLALAELQSPDAPRPGLHLMAALSEGLFGASLPPLAWPNHRLVRTGVLNIIGDGPMPTRSLSMAPELWALLGGDPSAWRHTTVLQPSGAMLPQQVEEQLPTLAGMLRSGVTQHVVFRGARAAGLAAAARLAAAVGRPALQMDATTWLGQPPLAAACRYAGWLPVLVLELGPGDRHELPASPALAVPLLIVCGRDGAIEGPALVEMELPALSGSERLQAWRAALPAQEARLGVDFAGQALLDGPTVQALAERVRLDAQLRGEAPGLTHLRRARIGFGSERLRQLAQPVPREVGPDELVLPDDLSSALNALVARCRRREQLHHGLGASLADPAPGVRALFSGESGSGKTLAASRLATLLSAPLFRVDLSAVMNKYIGETEKNLGRLLDEAAALDVILLIDEADALFGRRTEGKETGERYANMLTNFLLTRIEQHPGVVVLTSNGRGRIDGAFTRRFDAILDFPSPGVAERLRIWRTHLGARAPDDAACRHLAAYCDLPAAHIRNAVLQAAALDPLDTGASLRPAPRGQAPSGPRPLAVAQLADALLGEYRKLGRGAPKQLTQLCG